MLRPKSADGPVCGSSTTGCGREAPLPARDVWRVACAKAAVRTPMAMASVCSDLSVARTPPPVHRWVRSRPRMCPGRPDPDRRALVYGHDSGWCCRRAAHLRAVRAVDFDPMGVTSASRRRGTPGRDVSRLTGLRAGPSVALFGMPDRRTYMRTRRTLVARGTRSQSGDSGADRVEGNRGMDAGSFSWVGSRGPGDQSATPDASRLWVNGCISPGGASGLLVLSTAAPVLSSVFGRTRVVADE
jgi:hypothetical protein